LARILSPEHFGALAVALVVQTVAVNMAELGATSAIGRADRDPDEIAPTVFTFSLFTSIVVTAAVMFLAEPLAAFMGDPAAAPVVQVMSLTILLAGCSGVPAAMVWREYLQRPRTIVELTGATASFVLVIPFAALGWGAFALVWSRVIGQLLITIGYWIVTPKRYGIGFDRRVAAYVLRLGLPLAAANLVVFATLNLDYIVIGRELGAGELGVYLLAFNLASMPSTLISAVIRTVAVPTFGRLHAAGILGVKLPVLMACSAYLALPVSALLVGLAHPLVDVLYGPGWSAAGAAMIGLGVFGAGRILTEMLADICVGVGRTGALFWIQAIWMLSLLPALLVGVRLGGITGVAVGHAVIVWVIVVPSYFILVRHLLGVGIRPTLLRCLLPLLVSVVVGAMAWGVSTLVPSDAGGVIAGGTVGAGLYILLIWRHARRLIRELSGLAQATDLTEPPEPGRGSDASEREAPISPPPAHTCMADSHLAKEIQS
jgi:Membrane protein involved in the export of O-antigen and teichoic acid